MNCKVGLSVVLAQTETSLLFQHSQGPRRLNPNDFGVSTTIGWIAMKFGTDTYSNFTTNYLQNYSDIPVSFRCRMSNTVNDIIMCHVSIQYHALVLPWKSWE